MDLEIVLRRPEVRGDAADSTGSRIFQDGIAGALSWLAKPAANPTTT
jgi:hypothetical protein